MIEIFYHLIDEKEIIGVGPLMRKRASNAAEFMAFGNVMFEFQIYTRSNCITISTNWVPAATEPENFKKEYEAIKTVHTELWEGLKAGRDLSLIF